MLLCARWQEQRVLVARAGGLIGDARIAQEAPIPLLFDRSAPPLR